MATSHALRRDRFEHACRWLALGVPIVPLKPRSKHIQPGFGPHKTHISDPAFARRWFFHSDANLAVVLGGPVGLVVADWDDPSAFRSWRASLGSAVVSLAERTARGYHLFFLAQNMPSATGDACELKTGGVCMVSPSLHPSGFLYRVVLHAPIAPLDLSSALALFPFLSDTPSHKPSRCFSNPLTAPLQGGLIARIKAARPILDELLDAGISLRPAGRDSLVGLCPFHDDHSPSLWVYPLRGLWGCNRPDCSAAGTHDVINFRARYRRISNHAAIRQLADELL